MTTRSGSHINGKHFRQTINIAGRAQHFIDGKPVSGKAFRSEWAAARAAASAPKPTALDTFTARKHEIDALLARIASASDDHFGRMPDSVNWGDAGSLGFVVEKLKEITEFMNI